MKHNLFASFVVISLGSVCPSMEIPLTVDQGGTNKEDSLQASSVKQDLQQADILDVYHGYEVSFYRTLRSIGKQDTEWEIDQVQQHPFVHNPTDGVSYTLSYAPEGQSFDGAIALIGNAPMQKVGLSGKHKITPVRPAPAEVLEATPETFADQLSIAQLVSPAQQVEIRLADGVYKVGDLEISKANFALRALNPGQVVFSNKVAPQLTFALIEGTTDVYHAIGAPIDTSQCFWNDGKGEKRLSPSYTNTKKWTGKHLDASPNGGWFYDEGQLHVKIPGGGVPADLSFSGRFDRFASFTGDNVWIEGCTFEFYGGPLATGPWPQDAGLSFVDVENVTIVDCEFRFNLQSPIRLTRVNDFFISDNVLRDNHDWMTYGQSRNSSQLAFPYQFIGSCTLFASDCLGGAIRNNRFQQGIRGVNITSSDCIEIHKNTLRRIRGNLFSLRGCGGRISIACNTSDQSGWAIPSNEQDSPIGPVYWINNKALRVGYAGNDWDSQTRSGASANRYGGDNYYSTGHIGQHFLYNNSISVSETNPNFTTHFGWVSANRKFRGSRFRNNIWVSLKPPSAKPGSYGVIYACCGATAGQDAAAGIDWDWNQYWILNGKFNEPAFNFGLGQHNFRATKRKLKIEYGITWEPNGSYVNPRFANGQPTNRSLGVTIPGVTGNAVIQSPPAQAGASSKSPP